MSRERSLVAHLFRRAAFGARTAELDHYEKKGYRVAVEDLLAGRLATSQPPIDQTLDPISRLLENVGGRIASTPLKKIQASWVLRMVTTTAPLVERMVLFLHDHWATAYRPGDHIGTQELQAQNALFRSHALGDWRALCHAMIEDVALSNWLNNGVNVKQHPNENLAREFMELFTLGPGNYTEEDVREGARALTGFVMKPNRDATGSRYRMSFDRRRHDSGRKTILGQTGAFDPHDFVDIVLSQGAASRFLAQKLAEWSLVPEPSGGFVDRIAQQLVKSDWEVGAALRFIFNSEEFRSDAVRSTIVKSPTEFVVGILRSLALFSGPDVAAAVHWLGEAGQELFAPPTVAGWPKNMGWLGAGGVLARYNAGVALVDRYVDSPKGLRKVASSMPPAAWAEMFGVTELSPATIRAMNDYARRSATESPTKISAAMITLFLASPEYLLS